jgi:hypothetical protein
MENIIKRYEALTSEQKEMYRDGLKWAYESISTLLKKEEEERTEMEKSIKNMEEMEDDLNTDSDLIKKRRLLLEQFKELWELELELKWIPLLVSTMD